jgi:hypothetical protein
MGMKLVTLREGNILRVSDNRMLRRIFGHTMEEVMEARKVCIMSFITCMLHHILG